MSSTFPSEDSRQLRIPSRTDSAALGPVLFIAAAVFVLDQGSKAWITAWLGPAAGQHSQQIVGGVLTIRYARNSGAAFGLFDNQGTLLALLAAVVVAALLVAVRREALVAPWQRSTVGLIVGGALGNLIDRLRLGYVTDFIDVGRWPTFNLADSAITIGICLIIFHAFAPSSQSRLTPDGESPT